METSLKSFVLERINTVIQNDKFNSIINSIEEILVKRLRDILKQSSIIV